MNRFPSRNARRFWLCGLLLGLLALFCARASGSGPDLAGSRQGLSAAFADVDGDGVPDKLVGAPYARSSSGVGVVLVYPGTPQGYETNPSLLLEGGDHFGFAVRNVGDVDGDGREDFAVGAIHGSGDGEDEGSLSGAVTIFQGGGKGKVLRRVGGEGPLDKFGFCLAAGDFNGDGRREMSVGAPFHTPEPALFSQGAVYVYLGPESRRPLRLPAGPAAKGLGWSVAAADVNGDGVDDLLLSATGKVLGFYGGRSFSPSVATPDLIVESSARGFGRALCAMGDLDGDKVPELAIGAPNAVAEGKQEAGCVLVVRGGTGKRTIRLDGQPAPAELLARVCGASSFDRFGSTLEAVGGGEAGGSLGLAVGAPLADSSAGPLSGAVYYFKASSLAGGAALAGAARIGGLARDQNFGAAMVSRGRNVLLIGGPRSDGDTGGTVLLDLGVARPAAEVKRERERLGEAEGCGCD
ncbi:MAG: FG-GAP repeat protein [Deltaproteobacteria bacterium]|nr:FG-GAP repeat protein [Deltaproteobacteria bacterium]